MIDFHTHILPNIDDGASSVEVSSELLAMEAEQDVKEIVFTPHYYGKRTVEEFIALREAAVSQIREFVPEGMKFRSGAEVHLTGINDPADETLCALAIEGTKCVLLEFPVSTAWSDRLLERVNTFISDTGYTPVIAHVERYAEALSTPDVVFELVRMGCLIQLNTRAFTEKSTRRFAFALLKHGLVHCIGTDAHDLEKRIPDYLSAERVVADAGYETEWSELQWCMRMMLAGETIRKPFSPVRKFGKFYY